MTRRLDGDAAAADPQESDVPDAHLSNAVADVLECAAEMLRCLHETDADAADRALRAARAAVVSASMAVRRLPELQNAR